MSGGSLTARAPTRYTCSNFETPGRDTHNRLIAAQRRSPGANLIGSVRVYAEASRAVTAHRTDSRVRCSRSRRRNCSTPLGAPAQPRTPFAGDGRAQPVSSSIKQANRTTLKTGGPTAGLWPRRAGCSAAAQSGVVQVCSCLSLLIYTPIHYPLLVPEVVNPRWVPTLGRPAARA